MMHKIRPLLIIVLLAGFVSESADNAAAYYPLAPGDTWTYQFGGGNGTAVYEVTGYSDEYKGYIIKRCAKMIDVSLTTEKITGVSDGRVMLIGGTELGTGEYMQVYDDSEVLLGSPVKTGTTWEYKKDNSGNGLECRVMCRVAKVSDIDVKAGHFRNVCMVERTASYIDKDGKERYREVHNEYYAPRVGLIREELVEDANDALRAGHPVPLDPPALLLELVSCKVN